MFVLYEYALSPRSIWQRFRANKVAIFGLGVILTVAAMAIFAPILATHDPYLITPAHKFLPPSPEHWFGTDNLGRDSYSRIMFGSRISLLVGLVASMIASVIGIIVGALTGYYRGWLDEIIMRITDVFLVIPQFFLFVMVLTAIRTRSSLVIALMLGVLIWPRMARLVRSEFLSLRELNYTKAAKAIGASDFRIIFRHLLPNALPVIPVTMMFYVSISILSQATLAFLGLGDPSELSWGILLKVGQEEMRYHWWMATFPGLLLFITVLGFMCIGDGLRDILDPRLRGAKGRRKEWMKSS